MGAIFGDCRRALDGMQFGVVVQVLFVLLLEVLLTAWAYFPDNWKPYRF